MTGLLELILQLGFQVWVHLAFAEKII
ncbi:hypothetical protein LYNGBM3L_42880 [Moorena producens 3L]|uniref:Uncharacterized protein n=1 Tax=Moorena producens 3L TaxID=489825 RepID=F4XW86_9CYAN|nr:hypothetical protein LYNGBM3L_42880 [Moorena producens 3L]